MAKVILDAAHGGTNLGMIYNNRYEKNDNLRITLLVGDILKKNGVEVVYTRRQDIYLTPTEKVAIANQEGGDLFVSFQRKLGPAPNIFSGCRAFIYDNSHSEELATKLLTNLESIGFHNLGIDYRHRMILRDIRMPSVILNIGFIDSTFDNHLFDTKIYDIAHVIALGILEILNK